MRKPFLILISTLFTIASYGQSSDSVMIDKIFTYCLESGKAHDKLLQLTGNIGNRLSGSANAEKAVAWAKNSLESEKAARVYLQDVMVPHWVRNNTESMLLVSGSDKTSLRVCSLGGSVATPNGGIKAKVIEVKSFEELEALGKEKVSGNIVFYNAPMKQQHYHTFDAYSESGKYRWAGAINAAKYGAVASVTRSLTLAMDNHPHTGAMGYNDTITKIPACAVSTIGAEILHNALVKDPNAELILNMNCETLPDVASNNVIAEIKGTEHPEEIIVVGGHLDSWDVGQGAHDDGAGCVQAMELIRVFRDLGIKPKRTIRVVLFMNEENGLRGGKKYAQAAKENGEKHIAAIESDEGGFTPAGFSSSCTDSTKQLYFRQWKKLFEPYGMFQWDQNGGGADISPLKESGTLMIGLQPDSQRYFDYHHTEIDTYDKVNRRELHLGAAAVASMAWLLSEYGLK